MAESIERNGGTLNLFEKGKSGNPSGRPKGSRNLKAILTEMLELTSDVTLEDGRTFTVTKSEQIAIELLRLATSSGVNDAVKLRAIETIFDRIEGKPIPILPPPPENDDEVVVFYIPNVNSRKREDTQDSEPYQMGTRE